MYGLAEATAQRDPATNLWLSSSTVDRTRRRTESEAFAPLVAAVEAAWSRVAAQLGPEAEGPPGAEPTPETGPALAGPGGSAAGAP